jgi:hypothetical protein
MAKLFGGMLVIVAGFFVAAKAFYYAWASGTPGFPAEAYQEYQFYSMIFGIFSIGMILGGVYMIFSSIRKMNRDYKESKERKGT